MRGGKKTKCGKLGYGVAVPGGFHNLPVPGPEQHDLNVKRTFNFSMIRLQLEHGPGPGTE